MKYSYQWLGEYLGQSLPKAEELAREITVKAFEVEGMEPQVGDTIFDIKVLPDRAHDALSHRGMAREIGALLHIPRKEQVFTEVSRDKKVPPVRVRVADPKLCPRYLATRIDHVTIGPSPKVIATKIEAVGGRSINNIVDITNVVLFAIGQPLHAFDAAKVVGGVTVRLARPGEQMTTLDNKALTFDGTEVVIADDEGVLALAGIKGGKKAEVTSGTTSIILECANFDPTETRKTSTRHNIKTDASKRYENGMTSLFAKEGCDLALSLIASCGGSAVRIGETTDVYPAPETSVSVAVSAHDVNHLLGLTLSFDEVANVLARDRLSFTKEGDSFIAEIPLERLDLRIKEDLIEEVGRLYGYDKITPALPQLGRTGLPNKRLYYANKVRNFLVERGFSEVYTYAFAPKGEGDIEVINPVGKDRPFMRSQLWFGLQTALINNFFNAPLLEEKAIRIFEFGNVFTPKDEQLHLAVGVQTAEKKEIPQLENELNAVIAEMKEMFNEIPAPISVSGNGCFINEFDFDEVIKNISEPLANEALVGANPNVVYKPFSKFPHIVRDVALWVPKETKAEDVEKTVRTNAGELAQKIYLFDTFEKTDKKSFAFRIVLQSFERTLEDAEANAVYDKVVSALEKTNPAWEARK